MTIKPTLPAPRALPRRLLTSAEFSKLKDVPAEAEWFANIESPGEVPPVLVRFGAGVRG
jgi:hypothetical protein